MALTGVVVVVTFLLNVLQIIYGSKSVSPLDTHPKIMLIAISSFLLYCFACYLKHHLTSVFRSSTWPALLIIYNNFTRFLGFISMVSLASIIFSTSSTSLAIVYLLSFLFFSGKSGLYLIQNRNSLYAMRRSNKCSNIYMQDNRFTNLISMVEHGMVNMKSMVEVEFPFGRMNEILDVELGLGTYNAALESFLGNFGRGEGKDGPNPKSPEKVILDEKSYKELVCQARRVFRSEKELKRKHKECMSPRGKAPAKLGGEVNAKKRRALPQKGIVITEVENNSGVQRFHDSGIVTKLGFPQDNPKGKSKMVGEKLFNNNGLWSQEAIAALEKGKDVNKKLRKMVLTLEDEVIGNVPLADWLEKAIQDQHGLMQKRSPSWKKQVSRVGNSRG